jgi:hypothetical protein
MKSQGSLVPVGLIALTLGVGVGCKGKEEPPKPDPAAQAPASAHPMPGRVNTRNPMGPIRVDPQEMKNYRIDVCYYGTLSLRQARDTYLASLGKDEPSEKKIPSFGAPPGGTPTGGAAPKATSKPAAPGTPAPGAPVPGPPAASGPAGAQPPARPDLAFRMPYERNARACTIADRLKEPPMGDVDTAMAAYAPFALELARNVTLAAQYYQREEYKKDSFAKGKELDKKLREGFAKLDEMQEKMHAAIVAWHKDHPPDASKMAEGEKPARAALDDARDVFMLVAMKKADGEGYKSALEKLEKSADALKTYAGGHQMDTWSRVMSTPIETFLKTAKESKVTPDKTFDAEAFLTLVQNFVGLVEARQRCVSRGAMAHPAMVPQVPPGAPVEPTPPVAPTAQP